MLIAFELSMPSNNAWNGRWTGDGIVYAIVRSVRSARAAAKLLEDPRHHYSFGDGWVACVSVREVDAREARWLRKKSKGFCGYDWMVNEICTHGRILGPNERAKLQAVGPCPDGE